MKTKISQVLYYGLLVVAVVGCSKEDVTTPCADGLNAKVNNECGLVFVSYIRSNGPGEFTELDIKWADGFSQILKLTIEDDMPLAEKTYEMDKINSLKFPRVTFWFPEVNRRDKMTLTITKLDRENNLMSGHFNVEAEGFTGTAGYNFVANGTFEDAIIRQ